MSNPLGTYTLFKRESRRFLKVYLQTILSPVISNILYLAIFGLSLHRAIPNIGGISYLQFLAPGLIIMGIINNAFQNPSSSLIISKYQGLIADLLTIPLKRSEIFIAFTASAVLRSIIVGLATWLTIIFFVPLPYTSIITIILCSLLVSAFFSFLGIFVGIWAKEFDQIAIMQNFVLMPLIFLGGVFYNIGSLPQTAQIITKFNPLVYMIDLLRYGFTGVHYFSITLNYSIVIAATAIIGLATYYLLKTGWRLQN